MSRRATIAERGIAWEGSAREFLATSNSIPFYAQITRILVDALPADARRIIDFGCGFGRTTRAILDSRPASGLEIYLIDKSKEMLSLTEDIDAPGARFTRLSCDDRLAPLEAGKQPPFDAITCNGSMYLLRGSEGEIDLEPFLRRSREVLCPGGCILATFPDQTYIFADGWRSLFHEYACSLSPDSGFRASLPLFSDDLLREAGGNHGFAVTAENHLLRVSWRDFVSFYSIPALGASRLPHLNQEERHQWLRGLSPRFDNIDYRWVLIKMEKIA